ncbi:hypothetical protein OAX78_00755 [Planctomycetota bacterium]|nr:hypothetical protein [Planctomycetota bacterium]
MTSTKTIGLLVGDELDWPATFEALLERMGWKLNFKGEEFEIHVRRMRIDPFSLKDPSKCDVIIDRLAYWHFSPREWLKKVALIDETYLLNNPFTFQSMEKHSAYCAMMRLGLNIPETWLIPQKEGPAAYKDKYARTAERYHNLFDLPAIADEIGYPLFMKPFDGGGWRDVTRIKDKEGLLKAYDRSGQTLMHLQQGIHDYDVFCRSLAIGPQVINLKFVPENPQHGRYQISHGFLSPEDGREVRIITKLINAFFRWDFNSCETIHKDGLVWPIDFANACPDIAVNSLHYYYPWAIKSLVSWTLFCAVTDRPMQIAMDPKPYFAIADSDMSYEDKLTEYEKLADAHFQTEEFNAFCEESLGNLDDLLVDLFQSDDFDGILDATVGDVFPLKEQPMFKAHFKGLIMHWVQGQLPEPEPAAEGAAEPEAEPADEVAAPAAADAVDEVAGA